ncbi:MAG: sigma-E processing peptidase SpoIIGA [Oscillospiraceae bacterium]|nr:sigma-E processing peptidase SpoIIGA [Oscillospiraceae bacterium]
MILIHTIYIDVLLILNLYVNWLLLRGTAKLTHTRLSGIRCILAAAAGSLTSLSVLLPPVPAVLSLGLKLLSAVIPVAAAFGISSARRFFRCLAVFLCTSFAFAGFMLAVCSFSDTNILIWSGSCIYLHFSLTALILCTAAAYFFLRLFSWVRLRYFHSDEMYEVILRLGTHTAKQKGIPDTGNSLTDCFTGMPVIIFGKEALLSIPGISEPEKLPGYRPVPFSTVSGSDVIAAFRPEEIIIRSISSGKIIKIDALAGIAEGQKSAIFNPNLLHVM